MDKNPEKRFSSFLKEELSGTLILLIILLLFFLILF